MTFFGGRTPGKLSLGYSLSAVHAWSAFGGFAYLIGSFFIGLFSKVPQDDAAMGQDGGRRRRCGG